MRPMLRAVGHGVPTAHGPKWADSCGSRWEQRVLLRPPVDEQLGRNALREVRESEHPMTAPDPLALAAEAERAICSRVVGKDRDYGPLTNREYQDILALAAALRAAHEELGIIRAIVGATQTETTLDAVRDMDATLDHYIGKAQELFEENTRLREALGPFAMFAEKWDAKPMYRLHNVLYRIHFGTEWQAELRLSDMRRARQALAGGKGEG